MPRVLITGGSGKLGRATVEHLVAHGYDVIVVDVAVPSASDVPYMTVDLEDLNATVEAFSGWDWHHSRKVDAVVHLAAVSGPGKVPNGQAFKANTVSTYNVFEACRRLGINNVVWASSETLQGIPYAEAPPYLPADEEYFARPETAYSLSKFVGEEIAKQYCRWAPDMKIIGLRFSNVMQPEDYASFPSYEENPASRMWNLWTYIDARDGAQAIRKSLELDRPGADVFIIANDDSVVTRTNRELIAEFFPDVPLKREISDHESLLSIEKARRVLGFKPEHTWRR